MIWCFNSSNWRCADLLSFIAFAIPAAPPTSESTTPSSGRIGKKPRFATGSVRFFVDFFFIFKPIPSFRLGFHSCSNSSSSSSFSENRICRSNTFPCLLGKYQLRVVLRDLCSVNKLYRVFATRRIQRINASITSNQSLFYNKCVLGPQNWYPGICNSNGSAFIAWYKKPQPFVIIDSNFL